MRPSIIFFDEIGMVEIERGVWPKKIWPSSFLDSCYISGVDDERAGSDLLAIINGG